MLKYIGKTQKYFFEWRYTMKKVAIACAQDDAVLEAVKAAKERGIADAILVGDEAKIRTIARVLKMDLKDYEISESLAFALKCCKIKQVKFKNFLKKFFQKLLTDHSSLWYNIRLGDYRGIEQMFV